MKNNQYNSLILLAISIITMPISYGKIGDCPAIEQDGVLYHSHDDYIEAIKINQVFDYKDKDKAESLELATESTDITSVYSQNKIYHGKLIWHTQLFTEQYFDDYNPLVEADVQWNISCVKEVTDNSVLVSDNMEREFYVDKQTGKLLKAMKDGKQIANPMDKATENPTLGSNWFNIGLALLFIAGIFAVVVFRKSRKDTNP